MARHRSPAAALSPDDPPGLPAGMGSAAREIAAREIAAARAARAFLGIDLDAIRHNLAVISRWSAGARVMAVVKGDGYGLGAATLGRALQLAGVPAFAVDNVAEGMALRAAGVGQPILVLDGDVADNAPLAVAHGLMPGIPQDGLLAAFERAAAGGGRHPVWLAANVGFNRSGYREAPDFERFAARAAACPHLEVVGIYAHLTNSNGAADVSRRQIEEFGEAARRARRIFGERLETSLFASHGLVRWAAAVPTDWVRPGVLLYGEHDFLDELIEPAVKTAVGDLRPAVRLSARVLHLLEFDHDEGVGYGQHHRARPGQRLATVACGFGSGYPGSGSLEALVHGRRVPVFGAPGMDALHLDVTQVPGVQVGDWVTLLGSEAGERISATELARRGGMSTYQLLSRLSCQRRYFGSAASLLAGEA